MQNLSKIIAFFLTFLINGLIAFFMFGALIVGMNGFPSEKSAEPGIILYLIWAIVSTVIVSLLSALTVYFLDHKKNINSWLATVIAVIIFSIIGGISIFLGWMAGLAWASYLFANR